MKIDRTRLKPIDLTPYTTAFNSLQKNKVYRSKTNYNRYRKDHSFCEFPRCGEQSADAHHIVYKSQGGGDEDANLIALCRAHHNQAHGKDSKQMRIGLLRVKGNK